MGTGEIKGFGVTLTIGVAASLFTALVVTRLIFNFLLDRNWIKSLPMFHLIRATKLDFHEDSPSRRSSCPGRSFSSAWVTGFLIAGRNCSAWISRAATARRSVFSKKWKWNRIRAALTQAGEKDSQIQYQKDVAGGGAETLRVTTSTGSAKKVEQALTETISAGAVRNHRPATASARWWATKSSARPSSPRCCRCSAF